VSSSSSESSSSSSDWVHITPGAVAWGEETPTMGEEAQSWLTWSDGQGGTPATDDWGLLCLAEGIEALSPVIHNGDGSNQLLTVTLGRYAADISAQGTFDVYIRGDNVYFTQDDVDPSTSPTWELYAGPIIRDWEYTQVRLVGT